MDPNPYKPPKETRAPNQAPVARPQTLAMLFVVPIGIILVISILICGVALYALLFVGISFE